MTISRRLFLSAPLVPAFAHAEDESGFSPLFNGRDLSGWRIREGPESSFYVKDQAIVIHEGSGYPAWLCSQQEYENFDLRCEFYVQGWSDSGIYLFAPEHGPPTESGVQIKLFQQVDATPVPWSMGAIFPVVAPRKVNVRQKNWNSLRIVSEWPRLQVWSNGELIQDVDRERQPELRDRLRKGYIGIASLQYPLQFRNLRIRALPSSTQWQNLYEASGDVAQNWFPSEGEPNFAELGGVLRGDGLGHIASKEKYKDFALQLYIRGSKYHNSGILFRSEGKGLKGKCHEIQLHNVEQAHYPTGSLYYFQRARYPKIRDEEWYLFQMFVAGASVRVRINGETVMEYAKLEQLDAGHIELQAHRKGTWTEFKQVQIRPL